MEWLDGMHRCCKRFKMIDMPIAVEVEDESDCEDAIELKGKLKKYRPIAASLGFLVNVEARATVMGEDKGPDSRQP